MGRIRPRRRARIDAVSLDDAPEKSGVAKYMDVIRAIKGTLPLVDPLVKGIRKAIAKPPTSPRAAAAQRSLEDGLTPEQSAELINMRNLERKRAAAAAERPMPATGAPMAGILPGSQFFAPQKDSPVVPLGGEPFPRMGFQKEIKGYVTPSTLIGEGLGGPFQYPQFTDRKVVRDSQPGLSSIKPPALSLDPRLTPMVNVPGEDPATRRLSDAQRAGIASVLRGRGVDVPANIPGVGKVSDQDIRESLGPLESVSDEDIATLRMQGRVAGPAKVPSIPETKLESPFLRPEPADLPERPSDMPAITPTVLPVPEGARLGQEPGPPPPMPAIPTEVGGVKVPMKDGRIDIAQLGKMFREKNVTDRKAARGDSALPEDLSQYSLAELRAIRKLAKTPADIRRLGAAARARGEYEMPPGLLGSIAGESGARAGEQYVLRELPAPMTESQRRLALLKVRKLLAEGRNIEAQALLRRAQAAEKAENIPLLRAKTQLTSARAWDIMRKAMRKMGRRAPGKLNKNFEYLPIRPGTPNNPTAETVWTVELKEGVRPTRALLKQLKKARAEARKVTPVQLFKAATKFEQNLIKQRNKEADLRIKREALELRKQGGGGGGGGTGRDSTFPNEGKETGKKTDKS